MADIWACGIMLYLLFTGKHPFYRVGDKVEQALERIKQGVTFSEGFPK